MVNFHLSSQEIWLEDGHILHAQAASEDGDYVDSTLDLNYYIGNNDGAFQWGGENYADSAGDISFSIEGDDSVPVLRATLNNVDGDGVDADLNLAEAIGNDNGVLVYVPPE
ncbi:hypothetical protein ACJ41O_010965 [Fusarium nematophilum]